jgi:hypothetical protein
MGTIRTTWLGSMSTGLAMFDRCEKAMIGNPVHVGEKKTREDHCERNSQERTCKNLKEERKESLI